jgi:hypothetical protein
MRHLARTSCALAACLLRRPGFAKAKALTFFSVWLSIGRLHELVA